MLLLIVIACQSGFYGQDCAFTCGNCDGGAPCNAVDGTCLSGCAPGWTGDTCNEGKIILTLKEPITTKDDQNLCGIILDFREVNILILHNI